MIAILCPGQGSQKPGFLSPWLDDEALRTRLAGLGDVVGLDLVRLGTEADEETIKDTAIAQPLIVAAGIVAGERLKEALTGEDLVWAGHSVGEITAAALSGVLSAEDALRFIKVRAEGMARAAAAEPTGMAAVLGGDEEQVRAAIEEAGLTAANANGGGQIVAAGTAAQLEAFAAAPPARTRVIPLKVAGAFHTHHMRPAVGPLQELARGLEPAEPVSTLLSNRDGKPVTSGAAALQSLVDQVTRPVRWDLCQQKLLELGVDSAWELPPAGTLTGLARRAMKGVPVTALSSPEQLPQP
ncbi:MULTISPECIES: ACP S-malonyltransferase [Rothia]|uniref:[acyl-carrier-protein] S-malonyltransferase n=1 Tax=Rothia kristinae TaxID=37923 RepID=A0A147E931_9MICC|nr:ACP S-malonyltransferase [Rothia kristinae]MDN5640395.1 ACP S-malonyltransferase [Actinomycetes bacterium]TDP56923.1 [acyl-carrier-protein] S-malonyltransferase [Kocuria sp. AG109]KTR37221.1 ACP S-malonyltransferase [Rothia kristinae]KTR58739.1 ACP S-malonyltransferase [Rothia kristinae]KTR69147.1 ACP S-malonyltransferase [Rothia kristinae]